MVNNDHLRTRITELQAQGQTDREWWDMKKASIQSEFMKELDEAPSGTAAASSTSKPISAAGTRRGSTDDDAVFVEGGGPAAGGGMGTGRKKKGKK